MSFGKSVAVGQEMGQSDPEGWCRSMFELIGLGGLELEGQDGRKAAQGRDKGRDHCISTEDTKNIPTPLVYQFSSRSGKGGRHCMLQILGSLCISNTMMTLEFRS